MREFVIPAVISYQFQVSNNRQSKVKERDIYYHLPGAGLGFMEKSLVITKILNSVVQFNVGYNVTETATDIVLGPYHDKVDKD